jgi:peptidoglycan/LPS O-acetylase OafA/YrhL
MESERTPYFPALDGLRALSVLLAIYQHAANKTPAMRRLQGNLGVDIFFVLSGFLITFLLNREKRETGKVDLAAFYVRRAFRILPIYSVVLATYISPYALFWVRGQVAGDERRVALFPYLLQ